MDEQMTKASLLETLQAKRAEWDALLAEVPEARMTEPGVAGEWSVKDIIAHLTRYERWMGDRMHENLRGETYVPTETDAMHFDERNNVFFQQDRNRTLPDVQAESRVAFQQLVEAVQAHTEAFLIEPQQFEGAPQPIVVWQMVRSEVYDHYGEHVPSVKRWLASRQVHDTILQFHTAFNRHDVDAIMALMTDDCVFENTFPAPDGTRYEGQAAVRAFWEAFFATSPYAYFDIEEIRAAEEWGILRWRYGWPEKDGRPGHVRGVDLYRVKAGKVAEKLSYVKG
jgi:ketosteroid isomerase-like protein